MIQGSRYMRKYTNEIEALWLKIDIYRSILIETLNDNIFFENYSKKDNFLKFYLIIIFNMVKPKLNSRGKRNPSIEEFSTIIINEESRRDLMMEPQNINNLIFY